MLMQVMVTQEQEEMVRRLKNLRLDDRAEQDKLANEVMARQEFPSIMGRPLAKFKPSEAQKNELSYIAKVFGGTLSSEYIKRKAEMEMAFRKYAVAHRDYIYQCKEIKIAWIAGLNSTLQGLGGIQGTSKQELISEALDIGLEVLISRYMDEKSAKTKERLNKAKALVKEIKPPEFPEPPKNPADVVLTLEELQRKYVQKKKFS